MCGIALLLRRRQADLQAEDADGDAATTAAWLAALREAIYPRGPDLQAEQELVLGEWRGHMLGAVLHMRGPEPRVQPAVDAHGNVLLWNGEVFGGALGSMADDGAVPGPEENDTDAVLAALGAVADDSDPQTVAQHVRGTLSGVAGPWAFIYFHRASHSLYFGRDRLGRRSLCFLEDPSGESVVLASTTAAVPPAAVPSGTPPPVWREVTVEGLWQLDMGGTSTISPIPIPWLRPPPFPPVGFPTVPPASSVEEAASLLLAALEEAVRRRVAAALPPLPPQQGEDEDEDGGAVAARVGILYSGGLDCQVLAALAHRFVPAGQPIDLVSVCFDAAGGHRSPDRLGALAGVAELRWVCPGRPWRLLGVDVSYGEVVAVEGRVKRLIHPCATPMDFNIAASFFFAARGRGRWLATVQQDAGGMGAFSVDGPAAGLLRYGKQAEPGQAAAAAAAPAALRAAAADGGAEPCGSPVCRRVAKPGCRRGLCGHCCTRAQRRALEAFMAAAESGGTEEEAAVADGVLCPGHKLNKKYLPPALRPLPQRQQQPHPPAQPPAAAADAATPSPSSTQPHCSRARLLLLGIGADEQLAGYGRHRSTFARGGVEALQRELALDLGRLWTRNLGRDDRCVAEHGREARFPYLDEDVMALVRALPMRLKFDLREPPGVGDKKVLRQVAGSLLGLEGAACLVKRAIQFGSRIAREANTHNFGSHRQGKQGRWLKSERSADFGVAGAAGGEQDED